MFIIRNVVIYKIKKNYFLYLLFVMLNKLMVLVGSFCIYRVDLICCFVIVVDYDVFFWIWIIYFWKLLCWVYFFWWLLMIFVVVGVICNFVFVLYYFSRSVYSFLIMYVRLLGKLSVFVIEIIKYGEFNEMDGI